MARKTKANVRKVRPRSAEQTPLENVIPRIRSQYKSLGRSAKSIADFVLHQPDAVVRMSVTELAEATEASQGSAWADFDDNGTVDQGDLSLLMLEMGGDDATYDMNGDGRVTQADATAFQALRRDWSTRATAATPVRPGSVLITAAR